MRDTAARAGRAKLGFTLVELLVTISIIGVLLGILTPVLGSARDSAQQVKCSSNLRQLAEGALAFSNDNKGKLCTGPFDNRKKKSYGAIDQSGWIADALLGGYDNPGQNLCPGNVAQFNQNLIMGRLNDGPYRNISEHERDELIDRGFNSNYVQSWFMGYSAMLNPYSNRAGRGMPPSDPKNIAGVLGPLEQKTLGVVSTSMTPLFGDGRTKDEADGYIDIRGSLERVVKALGDGPIIFGADGIYNYQSYSDFGPAHGRAAFIGGDVGSDRVVGNMAFADGHVAGFRDVDRSGSFGFATDSSGLALRDESGRPTYPEFDGKVFPGWLTNGAYP